MRSSPPTPWERIAPNLRDADILIPHQIIDYTWGRQHTYVEVGEIRHIDFTRPFR